MKYDSYSIKITEQEDRVNPSQGNFKLTEETVEIPEVAYASIDLGQTSTRISILLNVSAFLGVFSGITLGCVALFLVISLFVL